MLRKDQRKSMRFDLRLPIELIRAGGRAVSKSSETKNLSSGGVLFVTDSLLDLGEAIEYSIRLPADHRGPTIRLHCVGKVLRSEKHAARAPPSRGFRVAASLERWEFVRA